MKLPCEMIQDLLPLYHDGVCSEVSKTVVQEHLKTCEGCAKVLKNIDVEIDMPKLAADEVKPLEAIKSNWKRKTLRKGLCVGVVVFLVFLTCWWSLTQWCIIPLTGEDYITECYQLSNGYVYIGLSWNYGGCELIREEVYSETGEAYFYRLRPILARSEENGLRFRPEECFYFLPENRKGLTENGEVVEVSAVYAGTPENAVLLWETGAELPPAPAYVEEDYRQLEDAYNAPNAPERPATIHVIQGVPDTDGSQSSDFSSVSETVFPDNETTISTE